MNETTIIITGPRTWIDVNLSSIAGQIGVAVELRCTPSANSPLKA